MCVVNQLSETTHRSSACPANAILTRPATVVDRNARQFIQKYIRWCIAKRERIGNGYGQMTIDRSGVNGGGEESCRGWNRSRMKMLDWRILACVENVLHVRVTCRISKRATAPVNA